MAITLTTAARNAAVDGVVDLLDTGGADPNGDLVIFDGVTELARLPFNTTAFGNGGAVAVGRADMNTGVTVSATATATGTADIYQAQDRGNNEIWRGAVSTTGAELNLNTTSIAASDTVTVTSLTLTCPAS